MHEQRTFLVMGANGAIGSSVALQLRGMGHSIMLAGRNEAELQQISDEIDAPFAVADASSIPAFESMAQQCIDRFGGLHGIVNCAGSVLLKPAHLTTEDEFASTIADNLTSAFAAVRAAAKTMRTNGGSVVLMASSAGRLGLPNHEAIAAAKAGVIGLMQSAAATHASKDIRFNAIAPGLVKSKMTRRIWENEKSAEYSRRMHPLGRLGEPDEIARLIVWLLDPANSWITGQTIGVDGGLSTVAVANCA